MMKKLFSILILSIFFTGPTFAFNIGNIANPEKQSELAIRKVLATQVKYANKGNLNKFLSTFDKNYLNSDGYDLEKYSQLVLDIWKTYDNIKYKVIIKDIKVDNNKATVNVLENSYAKLAVTENYDGELKSESNSTYQLVKINGKWLISSDSVKDETTSLLYGDAKNIDIKLSVPELVDANTDYCASLEFVPPEGSLAIASIAADKVEYPQKQVKEVFRPLPEDNILERIFTANNENKDEYVVASVGITKTDIKDLSIKLSLSGFGYLIKRVSVNPIILEEYSNEQSK